MPKKNRYTKVVDEKFILPSEKGGGVIKFEVWEYEEKIVKYNMAYINKNIFPNDNGRVVDYDNSHNYHHKHYLGDIYEVNDFISYEELIKSFQTDIKEFMQW